MNLPDVNVLLHALRNDSPNHIPCRAWLEAELAMNGSLGVSRQALSGVLRISTHPRVYVPPTLPDVALDFCEKLWTAPTVTLVEPGPSHWTIFTNLVGSLQLKGNDVPDAWFAALAIESGCTWVTMDQGFKRFPGLSVRTP